MSSENTSDADTIIPKDSKPDSFIFDVVASVENRIRLTDRNPHHLLFESQTTNVPYLSVARDNTLMTKGPS
jgi:hypothetical protein